MVWMKIDLVFENDSAVQEVGREVEVACEDQPEAIGNLKQACGFVLSVEFEGHGDDEDIQEDDPDE